MDTQQVDGSVKKMATPHLVKTFLHVSPQCLHGVLSPHCVDDSFPLAPPVAPCHALIALMPLCTIIPPAMFLPLVAH